MSLDQKSGKHLKLKVEVFFHSNSIKRFLCVAYRNNKIFVQRTEVPLLLGRLD